MKKKYKLRSWVKITVCVLCMIITFIMGFVFGRITQNEQQPIVEVINKETKPEFTDTLAEFAVAGIHNSVNTALTESVTAGLVQEKVPSNLVYLGKFIITGYDDCELCQEEWVGMTAIGVAPTEYNTIAVDPSVIPLGSYVWIDGIRYHAEDVGGAINDNHIDIFVGSHEETYEEFCNKIADVYLEIQAVE